MKHIGWKTVSILTPLICVVLFGIGIVIDSTRSYNPFLGRSIASSTPHKRSTTGRWQNITKYDGNWSASTQYAVFSNVTIPRVIEFHIDHADLCSDSVRVVNVILTAAHHKDERERLRKEFPIPSDWRRVFIVGHPIVNATYQTRCRDGDMMVCQIDHAVEEDAYRENHLNGDIIFGNFFDTYQNLTIKTSAMLKWVTSRCPTAEYLFKMDDDVLPNFPVLQRMFHEWSETGRTEQRWVGLRMTYNALRKGYRNTVTYEEFPGLRYPYYASGSKYVMSMDVVHVMAAMSERVAFLPIEDVFMGICGHLAGLRLEHNDFRESLDYCGLGFTHSFARDVELALESWKSCTSWMQEVLD